jgi:glycerol kinase
MSRGVLALDQGSHASRACVFDESGALRATASVPVSTRRPAALQVEHDAYELVSTLQTAAESALHEARRRQPQFALTAAGLAVQRSTIVCCSRADGTALSPALSWQDRRNAAWLERLAPHAPRVRALTGLPLSPHYGASKIRWCLDNLPEVRRAAETGDLLAAPLASYLALHLGGRTRGGTASSDAANASRTQLFDSQQLDWSSELLRLFKIERRWLPRCKSTRDAWGTLRLSGNEVPLCAVTGDQSAVPYAEGEPDPATVYVNLGTGAFIQRPLQSRPDSPEPLLGSVLSRDSQKAIYSLEGTVNGAGSAVSWFCEQEQCQEDALWPVLDALPADVAPPIFLNGIGGLGSPWWRVAQDSRFVGELATPGNYKSSVPPDTALRFAALIESIAFMIAVNAEALARHAGPPRRVVMAGGMSRSGWLGRRLAALIGRPVEVIDAEASARGVAQLAAPEISSQWPRAPLHSYAPLPDKRLDARYRRFTDLLADPS